MLVPSAGGGSSTCRQSAALVACARRRSRLHDAGMSLQIATWTSFIDSFALALESPLRGRLQGVHHPPPRQDGRCHTRMCRFPSSCVRGHAQRLDSSLPRSYVDGTDEQVQHRHDCLIWASTASSTSPPAGSTGGPRVRRFWAHVFCRPRLGVWMSMSCCRGVGHSPFLCRASHASAQALRDRGCGVIDAPLSRLVCWGASNQAQIIECVLSLEPTNLFCLMSCEGLVCAWLGGASRQVADSSTCLRNTMIALTSMAVFCLGALRVLECVADLLRQAP